MNERTAELQGFVDACSAAYGKFATPAEGLRSAGEIFDLVTKPVQPVQPLDRPGVRLPACTYLDQALDSEFKEPILARLAASFRSIEPRLEWRRRPTYDKSTASENFIDGHANAMILGPGGIEDRKDVWIGATLLAPNVRYPDHDHTPEEVYLVLSEGEFFQEGRGWFTPGVGGSFYNVPHIKHAMRSGDTPLFAFWVLQVPAAA